MALSSSDLKSLMAASTKLRAAVHHFAPSLTIGTCAAISSPCDVFLLAKGDWHNLQTLVLKQPLELEQVLDLTCSYLPLLSSLEAQIQTRSTLSFSQLATGSWPLLEILNLSDSHLSTAAMAKVKRGKWPALRQLVLHRCRLDSKAVAHLTEANWHCLERLDLHGNELDAQDMACLASGFWPNLSILNAGQLLEHAAWCNLMTAAWPGLQSLAFTAEWPPQITEDCEGALHLHLLGPASSFPALSHCQIFQPVLCQFLVGGITNAWQGQLCTLQLTGCDITTAASYCISAGHWPVLQELDLQSTHVDAEVMFHLAKAKMPALRVLRLDNSTGLDPAAFAQLALGDWPILSCLTLNKVIKPQETLDSDDDTSLIWKSINCLEQLIEGKWPGLERLELSCCFIVDEALLVLIHGNWPRLRHLDLSHNSIGTDGCVFLRGRSKQQLRLKVNVLQPSKQLAAGNWPDLSCVDLTPLNVRLDTI